MVVLLAKRLFAALCIIAVCLIFYDVYWGYVSVAPHRNYRYCTPKKPPPEVFNKTAWRKYRLDANERGVPRVIHQTWKTTSVPKEFKKWMNSWCWNHASWQHWFWTDEDIRLLIKSRYPDYLILYDNYPTAIQRADAGRYFILDTVGGVYADLDMESLRPIDSLVKGSQCTVGEEPREHAELMYGKRHVVSNAVMACRPNHGFFNFVIRDLEHQFERAENKDDVLETTGPLMFTKNVDDYNIQLRGGAIKYRVEIVASWFLVPLYDTDKTSYFKGMCRSLSELEASSMEVCYGLQLNKYKQELTKDAYTNHHWVHTYSDSKLDRPNNSWSSWGRTIIRALSADIVVAHVLPIVLVFVCFALLIKMSSRPRTSMRKAAKPRRAALSRHF